MHRLLKNRAGYTLTETIIALVLTAIIGAAVTGVFVTHSRFFDTQEKQVFARGVSRTAMNMMLSELRMVEQGNGVVMVTDKLVSVRAPYALGVVCGSSGTLTISRFPTDPSMLNTAVYTGYAYRLPSGDYQYVTGGPAPTNGGGAVCTSAGIGVIDEGSGDGRAVQISFVPSPAPSAGTPVFFYQLVTYEFKASAAVPGAIGLYRQDATGTEEEILAPFDTTAGFRFYMDDTSPATATIPSGPPYDIKGLEVTLDGLSERGPDRQRAPLVTSVFFKNRH
jgi:type II secretory pathway pseudopilin PulG